MYYFKTLFTIILFLGLVHCGPTKTNKNNGTSEPNELSYCSTTSSHSSPITITGSADFEIRVASAGGLGSPDPTTIVAKAVEIAIKDSSGSIIQCAETDISGNFSFQVPNDSATYTVEVRSRSNNSRVKASILKSPSDKVPYTITKTFVANGSKDIGTLTAPADGTTTGGAFNILDQIYQANEYLRDEVNSTTCSGKPCSAFSVAPKVQVFWTPGENPGQYFGFPDNPLSFYVPEDDELYILGGLYGDMDSSDTDHFDNSVILHEYGHFLEDQLAKTDSPGGPHNGNSIIDPRLAWGEGWANFFQAAVSGIPVYTDTWGNADGVTGIYFNRSLETGSAGEDLPSTLGEGNFREFSITRLLWDYIDTNDDGSDSISIEFAELWSVFTGSTGFPSTTHNFRNIGLFHELHTTIPPAETLTGVLNGENHRPNRNDYGLKLTKTAGTCTQFQIDGPSGSRSWDSSNQFSHNDFYEYTHTGGSVTLTLTYTNSSSTNNLDLYLLKPGYYFGLEDSYVQDKAIRLNDGGSESVTLPAGTYLINVHAQYGNTTKTYHLDVNGEWLCP